MCYQFNFESRASTKKISVFRVARNFFKRKAKKGAMPRLLWGFCLFVFRLANSPFFYFLWVKRSKQGQKREEKKKKVALFQQGKPPKFVTSEIFSTRIQTTVGQHCTSRDHAHAGLAQGHSPWAVVSALSEIIAALQFQEHAQFCAWGPAAFGSAIVSYQRNLQVYEKSWDLPPCEYSLRQKLDTGKRFLYSLRDII